MGKEEIQILIGNVKKNPLQDITKAIFKIHYKTLQKPYSKSITRKNSF